MNRFAKIMQFLGGLGVALLTVVWVQGFLVRGEALALARHSMIALAAVLLCVLPRFWTMAYLLLAAAGRAARRRRSAAASAGTAVRAAGERSASVRRLALIASGVALVALAGSFALAGAIVLRRASPVAHAAAGFVAIALQVVALRLERRALLADAEEMAAMTAMPAEAVAPGTSAAGEPVRGASSPGK